MSILIITLLLVACLASLLMDLVIGAQSSKQNLTEAISHVKGADLPRAEGRRPSQSQIDRGLLVNGTIAYSITALAIGVFTKSWPFGLVFGTLGFFYPVYRARVKEKKNKDKLHGQFRQGLQALSSSVRAGASLQQAIRSARVDLSRMFPLGDAPIVREFDEMVRLLELGLPVDDVLDNFAKRADIGDIHDFVSVAKLTRKKGGNINEVIANVSDVIGDKIEIEQEIQVLVAGKKSEAKVLTFMPIVLVMLLSVLSPTYMSPMFETLVGKLLLVVGLALLLVNYLIGKKIVDIEV